jgi:hypothetical protein
LQFCAEFSWLLTRERIPNDQTLADAQQVIDANGLADVFEITAQVNCPEDP